LDWIELDPTQQYLVAESREPEPDQPKAGEVGSPNTASATIGGDSGDSKPPLHYVLRILRRDTAKVMLLGHIKTEVHLPINDDGYIEETEGDKWARILNLSYFTGGSRVLASVDSLCQLTDSFVSAHEILATACGSNGDQLVAITTDGKVLWIDNTPPVAVWPIVTMAPNGQRIARATLGVTHSVNAYAQLDPEDIKGQWVTVYNAATGDMALETQASPVLDAGGNVAISPSGRRVAVLNGGAIQVFELPDAPPLPVTVLDK
jgi:hypothetical protein